MTIKKVSDFDNEFTQFRQESSQHRTEVNERLDKFSVELGAVESKLSEMMKMLSAIKLSHEQSLPKVGSPKAYIAVNKVPKRSSLKFDDLGFPIPSFKEKPEGSKSRGAIITGRIIRCRNLRCHYLRERILMDGYTRYGEEPLYCYLVGSFNGLICTCSSDAEIIVSNPCIREMRKLPYDFGSLCWSLCCRFSYDSSADDYKFVVGLLKGYRGVGIFWNGALHWVMYPQNHIKQKKKIKAVILSSDLSKENFKKIPQPDDDTLCKNIRIAYFYAWDDDERRQDRPDRNLLQQCTNG
nr:hypothetical protein [Tanacetum cinerariifolium]